MECKHDWEEIGWGVFSHMYRCKKCGKVTTTWM